MEFAWRCYCSFAKYCLSSWLATGHCLVQWIHHQWHLMVLWPDTRAHLWGDSGQNGLPHRFPGSATKKQSGPKSQVLVLHLPQCVCVKLFFFFNFFWKRAMHQWWFQSKEMFLFDTLSLYGACGTQLAGLTAICVLLCSFIVKIWPVLEVFAAASNVFTVLGFHLCWGCLWERNSEHPLLFDFVWLFAFVGLLAFLESYMVAVFYFLYKRIYMAKFLLCPSICWDVIRVQLYCSIMHSWYLYVRSKKHRGPKSKPMRAEAVNVTQFAWLTNCAVTSCFMKANANGPQRTQTYWALLHKSIFPYLFLSLLLPLFLFPPLWHLSRHPGPVRGVSPLNTVTWPPIEWFISEPQTKSSVFRARLASPSSAFSSGLQDHK